MACSTGAERARPWAVARIASWALVAGLAAHAAAAADLQDHAGLERLDSACEDPLVQRASTVQAWRQRLLDPDLARREASLAQLVEAVRRNPSLTGLLRSWASAEDQGELAWTARLALRELSRPPLFGFHGHLVEPLAPAGPPAGLEGRAADAHRTPPAGDPATNVGAPVVSLQVRATRGIHVQHVPGGVVVRLDTVVEGERRELSFGGTSLPQLVADHPELKRLLPLPADVAAAAHPDFWVGVRERRSPWAFGPPLATDVLGVAVCEPSEEVRRRLGLAQGGLVVQRVATDTIGEVLDLRAGSVLVEINGRLVESEESLSRILDARPPEGELRITLFDPLERLSVRTWRPPPPAAQTDALGAR